MTHIHDQYDFVVSAFIVYEDLVLFVNHPRYNNWLPVGGHVELDEDTDQALQREIDEETGLKVEILSQKTNIISPKSKILYRPDFVEAHYANAPHRHIALIYIARALSKDFRKSAEHTDMRWLSASDLDSKDYELSPALKFYAREALRVVRGR